jgi:hypothetical protein
MNYTKYSRICPFCEKELNNTRNYYHLYCKFCNFDRHYNKYEFYYYDFAQNKESNLDLENLMFWSIIIDLNQISYRLEIQNGDVDIYDLSNHTKFEFEKEDICLELNLNCDNLVDYCANLVDKLLRLKEFI